MANGSHSVHHLRLRAIDAAGIQRGVLLLEDALRTASLPDGGGRILCVRRLDLGRIAADAPPQTLALRIEQRFAQLEVERVHAGAPSAAAASAVWFRDALEAHTLAGLRCAAGETLDAWYWPSAIRAVKSSWAPGAGLRELALSVAALAEAAIALPAWTAALVRAGRGRRLLECLEDEDLVPLATAAGLKARRTEVEGHGKISLAWTKRNLLRALVRAADVGDADFPIDAVPPVKHKDCAAIAAERAVAGQNGDHLFRHTEGGVGRAVIRSERQPVSPKLAQGADSAERVAPSSPVRPLVQGLARQSAPTTSGDHPLQRQRNHRRQQHPIDESMRSATDGVAYRPQASASEVSSIEPGVGIASDLETAAGGLLFLIPVLARLGYAQWLAAQPDWQRWDIARRMLALVLGRVAIPARDPAWLLTATTPPRTRPPRRFVAPSEWRGELERGCGRPRLIQRDGLGCLYDASGRLLLGAWRGPRPCVLLARIKAAQPMPPQAGDPELVALVSAAWLAASRHWLRRHAGIGLFDLVARPAGIAMTPTHVDLYFGLDQVDLRLRRAGLDLDPGWLPWLGRVVAFHYSSREAT